MSNDTEPSKDQPIPARSRKPAAKRRTRRVAGTGAVIQRKGGRWEGRLKQDDGTFRSYYGKDQEEAEKRLDEAVATRASGLPLPDAKITVGGWMREWLASLPVTGPRRKGLKPSTIDYYTRYVDVHLLRSGLAAKPLARLEAADLERLYRKMTADPAEGGLGLVSEAAGLRGKPAAATHALGYKEVIELPAAVIEDRWHLNPGEGAAQLFMGSVTRGMMGGGFLYTNKESVALGIVVGMDWMRRRPDDLESWQLLDGLKELPQIRPLVAGGIVAEYSAHAIAEGGIAKVPKLLGDGYLMTGDAAGLSLNALVTVRGMDFAIASGYYAAKAVLEARKAGDFGAASLSRYETYLDHSFVLQDLRTAQAVPQVLENPRLFGHYPDAVTRLLEEVFTVGPGQTKRLMSTLFRGVRRDFLNVATLKDANEFRKL